MLMLIGRSSCQGQAGEIRRDYSTIDGRLTASCPMGFSVHGSKCARSPDWTLLHVTIENIHEQLACLAQKRRDRRIVMPPRY